MEKLTIEYLEKLKPAYTKNGYEIPKWIVFSETLLNNNCRVSLYKPKAGASKYVYVYKDNKKIKVRFSNHPPNPKKELERDCDYFVGVGNYGVMNTEIVLKKVMKELKCHTTANL